MSSLDALHDIREIGFLAGGGETGARIRSIDWSGTPLGAPEAWPQSLKTCVRIILTSRQPMFVWWGQQLINLYNDAYIDIVGGKHPEALGQPAQTVWHEIWDQVGPRVATAMNENKGTYDEALLLIMERNGYPEETYYTFSYSPVPGDDGGTAGIICANTDDTYRIIGERELRTLKDLGKSLINTKSNSEVFEKTISVLKENPQDFPYAYLYEVQDQGNSIRLLSGTSDDIDPLARPEFVNADNRDQYLTLMQAVATGKVMVAEGMSKRFAKLPKGAWPQLPDKTMVLPIQQSGQPHPFAVLMIGLNPYRRLDEKYSGFFQLVTDQILTSLSNVHAYEQERKRAEALAEIDRAKTTFFSNISHEFRTPLTLMLSPLQEVKNQEEKIPPALRDHIDVSYRNTLRLQKLVNSLLDFSRIEAGRMQAAYEETKLETVTRDLSSSFRSAIESAGLTYDVEIESLHDPVFVDPDMWEKIVLNLISNAFKYTLEGRIVVRLSQHGPTTSFSVEDSGVGIPPEELEKVFERFHRVQNLKGRSQEGTGIGLALVQELVRMHQGKISVKSTVGKGSVFTVEIPSGKDHLPPEKIADRGEHKHIAKVDAYVSEAGKWSVSDRMENNDEGLQEEGSKQFHILLADDNLDMRQYVRRLLGSQYKVTDVSNGRKALEFAASLQPDLIISDVMMPEMDGFELVKQLKSNSSLARIPVILLSARAGEEATLEGLRTGADDYLVKPFSARELLSRVDATIRLSVSRHEAERQYSDLFRQAPVAICILKGPEMVIELANAKILEIWGKSPDVQGKKILDAIPEIRGQAFPKLLQQVFDTQTPYYGNEAAVVLDRFGVQETRHVNFVYYPILGQRGQTTSILAIAYDVTELVESRKRAQDAEARLRLAAEGTGLGTWDLNLVTRDIIYSSRLNELFGYPKDHVLTHMDMRNHLHPDDRKNIVEKAFETAMQTGNYLYEARVVKADQSIIWIRTHGVVNFNEKHEPVRMLGTMRDVTTEKEAVNRLRESEERYRQLAQQLEMRVDERTRDLSEANENLARSNKELEQFAFVTSHDLQEPLRKIQTFGNMLVERYSAALEEKAKGYIGKMMSASNRMSTLIHDLLNFSRLRQPDTNFVPTDLNVVLANIKNDFELVIKDKHAEIRSNRLPTIDANPLQMNQLFYNLVSNAMKFTHADKPPVLTISCNEVDSSHPAGKTNQERGQKYYELVFRDNGIGFPQEYAEKIFEIFQRLNARSEYEGTGIGLALVNKIVENHGGEIKAYSSENEGSRFHIILPARQSGG